MYWLQIVLVSYFILSITNLVDKIFLSRIITSSIVYMLWVSIMSIIAVVLIALLVLGGQAVGLSFEQFGALSFMPILHIGIAIVIGVFFTAAIYFLYSGLQSGEASRVIPIMGGSMPIFAYLMTFMSDPLDRNKTIAFVILVVGTIIISLMPREKTARKSHTGKIIWFALAASFSFALMTVLSEYLFEVQNFVNGMIWPRLGSIIVIIIVLLQKRIRTMLRESFSGVSARNKTLWLANQGFNAAGFIGQQYAISLAAFIPGVSAALILALLGVQYSLLLIFATLLSFVLPKLLKEKVSAKIIIQKVLAIILITIGLYYVAM